MAIGGHHSLDRVGNTLFGQCCPVRRAHSECSYRQSGQSGQHCLGFRATVGFDKLFTFRIGIHISVRKQVKIQEQQPTLNTLRVGIST